MASGNFHVQHHLTFRDISDNTKKQPYSKTGRVILSIGILFVSVGVSIAIFIVYILFLYNIS